MLYDENESVVIGAFPLPLAPRISSSPPTVLPEKKTRKKQMKHAIQARLEKKTDATDSCARM